MSNWIHRIGAILGSAAVVLPILDAIPGAGPTVKVITTVVGLGITLATDLGKVFGSGQSQ